MELRGTRAKTRALKKYEAEPIVCASDHGEPGLDLFSPFGPMIARSRIEQGALERINRYADSQVNETGCEFLVPNQVLSEGGPQSLGRQIEAMIRRYVALVDRSSPARIVIDNVWIVSQFRGTPSPVHFHSGDISGVMYLKTPTLDHEEFETQKTYISGRQAGYINFMIGGKQRFSKSLISFRPEVGDFYVFPGWLLHGAEPFRGSGERRSLAFNAIVEGDSGSSDS